MPAKAAEEKSLRLLTAALKERAQLLAFGRMKKRFDERRPSRRQVQARSHKKPRQFLAGIGRTHQCLSDQKRVHTSCASAQRRPGNDAALGDDDSTSRHLRQQVERGLERSFKRAQVAVVDTDQRSLEIKRALQLDAS